MIYNTYINQDDEHGKSIGYQICRDDGVEMTHATVNTIRTRFAGSWIPTMTIGGVGTRPQFRRQGTVRELLENLMQSSRENGWYVSLLHPFSFSYYRKFGYERVSDTIIADMPMTALDFLPRYSDLVQLEEAEHPEDILGLFASFNKNRNLSFDRFSVDQFKKSKCYTYLYYNEVGTCTGYVITQIENHYDGINRMISDNLHVWEMGYLDRDALLHLLSFLRMFEGELKTIRFHDLGPIPEVDLCLKHFMDTRYDIHPDIMARILNTEAMLRVNAYPTERGIFTLRVEDWLPDVAGTFRVEYENGKCEVERLDSDLSKADLTVGPTALSKLFYGTDSFDATLASYLDGVKMENDAADFFRAFPKRTNGLFEHF
ncbi:MAG: GNAT family N-acetyltransferase [Clostridia bacterium]|nr:GNAT family N-acetyltransferase [Clostridia bacterium]